MNVSGHSFSKISDYVYSTYIKFSQTDERSVFYPLPLDKLKDNDIIYSKADFISNLFNEIKNINFKLKIITSESDIVITKEIFNSKPNCVEKWFAVNVCYDHEDLVPIPLGISNGNCSITLKFSHIEDVNGGKNKLLYVNHRINTNPKDRAWIYNSFETNEWCTVSQPNLSLEEYKKQLLQHSFMICPRGNGPDTHRLWECLYAGIVPVVEKHVTHKNMIDLPILFINSFSEITRDLLLSKLDLFNNKNLEKLDINYWLNFIKES
jgi:hypothetical protein